MDAIQNLALTQPSYTPEQQLNVNKFLDKICKELKQKCKEILSILTEQMLDLALDYDTVTQVLVLIGSIYHFQADAINIISTNIPNFEHPFDAEEVATQCQNYYKMGLKCATSNLDNGDPIKINLVVKICTFFEEIKKN